MEKRKLCSGKPVIFLFKIQFYKSPLKGLFLFYMFALTIKLKFYMKKTVFGIMLGLTVLITSCSSDNSPNVDTTIDITGNWDLVKQETRNGKITVTVEGEEVEVGFSIDGKNFNYQQFFGTDPNIVTGEGNYTQVTTISFLGQTETNEQQITDNGEFRGSTWEISGSNFIISNEETGDIVFSIKELTENTFRLEANLATLSEEAIAGLLAEQGFTGEFEVSGVIEVLYTR